MNPKKSAQKPEKQPQPGLLSTRLSPRMKKAFIASSPVLNDEMEAESLNPQRMNYRLVAGSA
jgi:hypothetical protein